MSSGAGREPVFPTRQALGQMKGKLKGAQTGHSLLKRKSEALTKYARYQELRALLTTVQALSRFELLITDPWRILIFIQRS